MSVPTAPSEPQAPTRDAPRLVDAWIVLAEELVVGNRQQVRQQVLDCLDRAERDIVVDLTGTRYIDASGLGVLVSLRKRVLDAGGTFWLVGQNADLDVLFDLTGIRSLFSFASADALRVRSA